MSTEATLADLVGRAEAWLGDDPDPATRAELAAAIDAARGGDPAAADDLADRFAGMLQFGTAGLRGIVGETLTPEVAIRYAAAFAASIGPGPMCCMLLADLGADVVRIDRDFTGRERRAYMQHALDEALQQAAHQRRAEELLERKAGEVLGGFGPG